jgi:hypothetical protein
VDRIAAVLKVISDEEGGEALALLCFEDVHAGQVCHRRMFAQWWEERTGQRVEELQFSVSSRNRQDAQSKLFEEGD